MSLPDPLWFTGAAGMCGIAAVLVAVFLKDFRLAIELAAVAVFLGLCAGVAYGYEDKGIAKQIAKDKPIIDNLTTNLATSQNNEKVLKKVIADSNLYIDQLQAQAKGAKDRAAAAIASAQKEVQAYEASIADLTAKLNAPPTLDVTAACAAAQKIIDGLIEGAR